MLDHAFGFGNWCFLGGWVLVFLRRDRSPGLCAATHTSSSMVISRTGIGALRTMIRAARRFAMSNPDTYDTDHSGPNDVCYVGIPTSTGVVQVHGRFSNLYAYFGQTGIMAIRLATQRKHGRYYVIVTIEWTATRNRLRAAEGAIPRATL